MDLANLVEDAGTYRFVDNNRLVASRQAIVFCNSDELEKAVAAFQKRYGRKPEYACFYDQEAGSGTVDSTSLPLAELVEKNHAIWCFGKRERRKGLRLAAAGVRDFYFAKDPEYKKSWGDPGYWIRNQSQLVTLFNRLFDSESRLTLASIIKSRVAEDHGFLRIATYREYFHPIVQAQPGDWVIDAGAYDGATSLAFAQASQTGKVFAFEPDPVNQESIRALIESQSGAAVAAMEIAPFALSDKSETLSFRSGKLGSSSLSKDAGKTEEGMIAVQAISLDSFVEAGKIPRVDLISIDIEGAEAVALEGMRKTIQRFRPKLQVSIYHKKNDLFELPQLVADLAEDYVFFLGHHNTYATETDLYAIPREKMPPSLDSDLYAPSRRLFATGIDALAPYYTRRNNWLSRLCNFWRS